MTSWTSVWSGSGAVHRVQRCTDVGDQPTALKDVSGDRCGRSRMAVCEKDRGRGISDLDLLKAGYELNRNPLSSLVLGMFALLTTFIVLVVWSALAPIAGATIATGTVVVENSRRTIEHRDGGTIQNINVHDGSVVHKGEVLIELDDHKLRSSQEITQQFFVADLLRIARLIAERNNSNDIAVPDEIKAFAPEYITKALDAQKGLMVSRRKALRTRISVIQSEQRQAEENLNGSDRQISSQKSRLDLTIQELLGAQTLAASGAGTRQRVLEISRGKAELEGVLESLQSRSAEARIRIDHGNAQIAQVMAEFYQSIETDIASAEHDVLENKERLQGLDQQIERLRIMAPVDGVVLSLAVHTVGGVVLAGNQLMEIVPTDERLVIEAQIRPEDIQAIHEGDPVDIRIGGSDMREMRRLTGHVLSRSADRLADRFKGLNFFVVRVEVNADDLQAVTGRQLRPGMAVDLFISKGQQTVVQYLLAPLIGFFDKGMRQ